MNKKMLIGSTILFAAAFVWGFAFVFQHTGMDNLEPFSFTAVRIGIGALSVCLIQLVTEGPKSFKLSKKTIKSGIICGLITFGVISCQQIGLVNTNPGKAGFITSLYIILTPIFTTLILKKKESLRTWVGVGVGLIGLYLLCVQKGSGFSLEISDMLIMCCAIFFALHVIYVGESCADADPLAVNWIQLAVTAILALIIALIFEEPTIEGIIAAKVPILYCGIVSAGLGYTFQIIGQKNVPPTVAAVIMSFESVFSVVASWFILHTMLSTRELVGCIVMFAANIIIQLTDKISYSDDLLRKQQDHPNV